MVLTAQLDQILGQTVVRGSAFTTPHNGAITQSANHDSPRSAEDNPKFPAGVAVLLKGKQEIGAWISKWIRKS